MRSQLHAVIKVGGSLLNDPPLHARVAQALGDLRGRYGLLIVPGGGPLADAVRALDERMSLGDDAAHWMAIRAMDQHAVLLADRIDGAVLVAAPSEVAEACAGGRLPVLAPSRWLEQADPLPHSWSVTSDSIAAWVAAALCVPRLVLIKSIDAPLSSVVDAHFAAALRSHIVASAISAGRIEELGVMLERS